MAYNKKVTMNDVAKYAGVSQSTVSMVFSDGSDYKLSDETIENVRRAADSLGYVWKKQSFADIQSKLIIAIFPTMLNLYYANILEVMRELCLEKGFTLLSYCSLRNPLEEAKLFDLIDHIPAAGIIFSYLPSNTEKLKNIAKTIPTVIIGDTSNNLTIDAVEMNSEKSGRLIASHLLELGHKHIAYVTSSLSQTRRLQGVQATLRESGIKEDLIVKTFYTDFTNYDEYTIGYQLTKEVITDNPEVTAIIGISDIFALGIIDSLIDAGFSVPKDYSVVGCDNTFIGRLRNVSLTTVDLCAEAKGQQAVELLLKKIKKLPTQENIPRGIVRVEYLPKLIVRTTTGTPRS